MPPSLCFQSFVMVATFQADVPGQMFLFRCFFFFLCFGHSAWLEKKVAGGQTWVCLADVILCSLFPEKLLFFESPMETLFWRLAACLLVSRCPFMCASSLLSFPHMNSTSSSSLLFCARQHLPNNTTALFLSLFLTFSVLHCFRQSSIVMNRQPLLQIDFHTRVSAVFVELSALFVCFSFSHSRGTSFLLLSNIPGHVSPHCASFPVIIFLLCLHLSVMSENLRSCDTSRC